MSMDGVKFDLEVRKRAQETEDFRIALRNPLERGILVVSDALQRLIRAIGRLLPDMGWTPPA